VRLLHRLIVLGLASTSGGNIVQAHRFVFDSRDEGAAEHLQAAGDTMGVWRCHTAFNCTLACPRGINITQAIGEVKHALATGRIE
jgi:succinate dehydrogenase / fumarate reductase iron-sulfur subunit